MLHCGARCHRAATGCIKQVFSLQNNEIGGSNIFTFTPSDSSDGDSFIISSDAGPGSKPYYLTVKEYDTGTAIIAPQRSISKAVIFHDHY